jgi:kynurenine/2-aminoadipate aminotransferase
MSRPASSSTSSSKKSTQKLDPRKYITALNSRREPSAIRSLLPLMALPGMISLGGGLPNPALFPFRGIKMSLSDTTELEFTPAELNEALQYSPTPGIPKFVAQLKEMMQREHKPQMDDSTWTVSVATGSTDAIFKAFDMLVEAGDNVLIEAPTYSGSLSALRPLQPNFLEIEVDEHGMIPSKLESVLNTPGLSRKPRVLYIIPTGQNPAGSTLTFERKKQIYALACKHDLIILEDDPYFFLSYGTAKAPAPGKEKDFVRPHNPSFFSLDTEGRVIRFDSFSKILSSGLRLGTVTGPKAFVERIDLMSQAANLHTSGVSQMMVSKLLTHWGESGWNQHIHQVCIFYARRRDVFVGLVEKHLKGLVDYGMPTAGMFLYLKLRGITDSKKLVETKALEAKVLMVPGQSFSPSDAPSNCVRAAFSVASDEAMETALKRFAALLKSETAGEAPKSKL